MLNNIKILGVDVKLEIHLCQDILKKFYILQKILDNSLMNYYIEM